MFSRLLIAAIVKTQIEPVWCVLTIVTAPLWILYSLHSLLFGGYGMHRIVPKSTDPNTALCEIERAREEGGDSRSRHASDWRRRSSVTATCENLSRGKVQNEIKDILVLKTRFGSCLYHVMDGKHFRHHLEVCQGAQ